MSRLSSIWSAPRRFSESRPFGENICIPGFSVEEHTPPGIWFADGVDGPWEWKGPAIRESGCAYGKFLRGKTMFVSREWFVDFANYRRDGYDFINLYEDGLASQQEKIIFDLLCENESLVSKEIKWRGGFGKHGYKGFDAAIGRLQMQGYVTTVDFEYQRDKYGLPYGWGLARYALPERRFGAAFSDNVYRREPEESKARIVGHLRKVFPYVDEKQILKVVGLTLPFSSATVLPNPLLPEVAKRTIFFPAALRLERDVPVANSRKRAYN